MPIKAEILLRKLSNRVQKHAGKWHEASLNSANNLRIIITNIKFICVQNTRT